MGAEHFEPGGRGDDFDALTDLFLGPEAVERRETVPMAPELKLAPRSLDDDDEQDEAPEALVTETLVLGHLPVRANPWVAQYARAAAERVRGGEGGRVALVRLGGGQAGIDLYGLDPSFRECQSEETVEGALARVACSCDRVIFQVTDTDELSLARSGAMDRVTVLTAGNDAAVVNVYRTIKALAGDVGTIGVAVMGEEESRARGVIAKLSEAARAFLDVELFEARIIDRMGPTGGAMVYLGACELGHEEIVDRLAALRETGEGDAVVRPVRAREPEAVPIEENTDETIHRDSAVDDAEAPAASRVDRHQDASTPIARPGEEDARSLAMSVLELKPIGASCPDDEGVVLARDGEGRLHLLCEDEERRGVERLTAVSSWASKHAKLLKALDVEVIADGEVISHLLTREAKGMRHLLDTDVRVHVMRRADERIGTGWVFVELN